MRLLVFGLALCLVSGLPRPAAAGTELAVVGTGDGLEMLREVGRHFTAAHPEIELTVPPSIGSGGGITAVGTGTERMGRVARPLSEAEIGHGLVYLPFARIPNAIFVHPSAGVAALSAADVAGLFSGAITNWSELGGADLRVRVVRREDGDSTLRELRATMPGWATLEFTVRSKTAHTTQEAIETTRQVEGAIAFGPYANPLEEGLTVLRIDGAHPTDQTYPSAVTLALIYKDGTLEPDMKSFIDYSLSDEARTVIRSFGGVPVSD